MAKHDASTLIMTVIKGYDSWKLDIPDPPEPPQPYETAVHSERGIFAWHDFCLKEQQDEVPDWAWEACRKGPFTTIMAKIVFAWNLLRAKLAGEKKPIHVAGRRSAEFVEPEYLEACGEVQDTWRWRLSEYNLEAVQENWEINLYRCDFKELE